MKQAEARINFIDSIALCDACRMRYDERFESYSRSIADFVSSTFQNLLKLNVLKYNLFISLPIFSPIPIKFLFIDRCFYSFNSLMTLAYFTFSKL